MNMSTIRIAPSTSINERRKAPRSPAEANFQPRQSGEREFGIGYGRSSGYARVRSYVSSQPAFFRCR